VDINFLKWCTHNFFEWISRRLFLNSGLGPDAWNLEEHSGSHGRTREINCDCTEGTWGVSATVGGVGETLSREDLEVGTL
jgi:hypothetical protein